MSKLGKATQHLPFMRKAEQEAGRRQMEQRQQAYRSQVQWTAEGAVPREQLPETLRPKPSEVGEELPPAPFVHGRRSFGKAAPHIEKFMGEISRRNAKARKALVEDIELSVFQKNARSREALQFTLDTDPLPSHSASSASSAAGGSTSSGRPGTARVLKDESKQKNRKKEKGQTKKNSQIPEGNRGTVDEVPAAAAAVAAAHAQPQMRMPRVRSDQQAPPASDSMEMEGGHSASGSSKKPAGGWRDKKGKPK